MISCACTDCCMLAALAASLPVWFWADCCHKQWWQNMLVLVTYFHSRTSIVVGGSRSACVAPVAVGLADLATFTLCAPQCLALTQRVLHVEAEHKGVRPAGHFYRVHPAPMFGTVSIAAAGYRFVAPYIDVCRDYYNSEFCTAVLNLIFFGPSMFVTPDETAVIFKTWPASVSMRNVGHWAQMLTDGQLRFQVRPSSM